MSKSLTTSRLTRRTFLRLTGSAGFMAIAGQLAIANQSSSRQLMKRGGKVQDVNTTDIKEAILLGCQTMGRVFNADDGDIPFFGSVVYPKAQLSFSDTHSESHVPGRHLNALLSAEQAVNYKVPEQVIEKHARAAFFSYSGPVPLPLNRDAIGGKLTRFVPHNLREGFHALYALAAYRDSSRAHELAEASIAAINQYWTPERGWDSFPLVVNLGLAVVEWNAPFISGIARAIGPLVKYYRATGYQPALELAMRLKEKAVAEHFLADGRFDLGRLGTHTHSVTCVMSSLAQLAEATGDGTLMDRIKVFYDVGLKNISDEIGWSIENAGPEANPDRGEANNTGDILETALILGRSGHTEYYHDAERILRAHLLPCQLRDVSFIQNPPNPQNEDGKREVARRHLGAFGFPAPYGHRPVGVSDISFNMDIVGGAVASLCEAYNHVISSDTVGIKINLLFGHETDEVRVESPYTEDALRIYVKRSAPLYVRIPPWVDKGLLSIEGSDNPIRFDGRYLFIPNTPVGQMLTVRFPLTRQEIALDHRTRCIRTVLEGDRVIAMDNFGTGLNFFDPA